MCSYLFFMNFTHLLPKAINQITFATGSTIYMKTLYPFLLFTFFSFLCYPLLSQNRIGGFKVGMNVSNITNIYERSPFSGKNGANTTPMIGWHAGYSTKYAASDIVGFRFDVLYSLKGVKQYYDGAAYKTYKANNGTRIYSQGKLTYDLTIKNTYIDIPITPYYRLNDNWEILGGAYFSVLLGSVGKGQMSYTGRTFDDTEIPMYKTDLNYDFIKDKPTTANPRQDSKQIFTENSAIVTAPISQGAYFELEGAEGSLFKRLDYGLIGGVNYGSPDNAYLAFRMGYGLMDITNNQNDFSRSEVDENYAPITKKSNNRNIFLQFSLGFGF